MALTDTEIRRSKPAVKPYKLADSGGLHLLITPSGGRLSRGNTASRGTEKMARIDAKELPALVRSIEVYEGRPLTRLAIKLMALTFVRTREMIDALGRIRFRSAPLVNSGCSNENEDSPHRPVVGPSH